MPRRDAKTGIDLLIAVPAIVAVSALAATSSLASQEQLPPAATDPTGLTLSIHPAQSTIIVDGKLDDDAWLDAASITLDYETQPAENTAPPVETECLITFDERHIYVAFRAHDPRPEEIRARLSDRDNAFDDDVVGVTFDTFNDERRAVQFFTNPLGVQIDLFVDDVAGRDNHAWDAIWDSAGSLTPDGYIVEMAIPFHQLRFPRQEGIQTWGFEALRFYPRQDRHRIASQPRRREIDCHLCQISKLTGLEGITPGRNIELVPTLTGGRTDEREDGELDNPFKNGTEESEMGLTARWGITPNLTLNLGLNPDFSQVEADVARIDLNTRFTLFFPERRPFFLEGADFFQTPLSAVFTRNVSDPAWGVKLSGKQGNGAMGIFVAQDEVTNLIFPGNQGSDSESFDFDSTDAVVRYRRDLGETSTIGALITSREGSGYSNRVAGVDGLYRFTESNSVRFQALASETEYPGFLAEEYEQPATPIDDTAVFVEFEHDSRNWSLEGGYEDIGADFRADMGFIPRVDYSAFWGDAERVWWGDREDWYNRVELGVGARRQEDQSGRLLEEGVEVWTSLEGPLQSRFRLSAMSRQRVYDDVTFDEEFIHAFVSIRPSGSLQLSLRARFGDEIDFDNTRPGEAIELRPEIQFNLGKHLRGSLRHSFERLEVEQGRLFTANLTQLRLVYQFNLRTFVRAIAQYSDVERDPDLYTDEVEAERERLFGQFLFSYKLNPQTVFFIGYTDTRVGEGLISLTETNRTFFMKLGYAWLR